MRTTGEPIKGISLERAAGISFVLHIVFFVFFSFALSPDKRTPTRVYTVSIVEPEAKAASIAKRPQAPEPAPEPAPAPEPLPEPETSPPPKADAVMKHEQRVPPPKKKPKARVEPSKEELAEQMAKQQAVEAAKAEQLKKSRLADLKQQQESDRVKARRLEELAAKKRLAAIKSKAASKSDSDIGKSKELTSAEKSKIVNEYSDFVQSAITKNWNHSEFEDMDLLTIVSVTIKADGTLIIGRVENPSGNTAYDESVYRAIIKTTSVEPPPFGKEITFGLKFHPYDD